MMEKKPKTKEELFNENTTDVNRGWQQSVRESTLSGQSPGPYTVEQGIAAIMAAKRPTVKQAAEVSPQASVSRRGLFGQPAKPTAAQAPQIKPASPSKKS